MIIGYLLEEYQNYGLKIPVEITLPKKTSNILLTGKSSSGKSLSARLYLWNALHCDKAIVYITDYKGGEEYEAFEGSPSYASGEQAINMIRDFYELFTEIRKKRIKLNTHIMLYIEEYFGLLTYLETQSKKEKAEIMSMIGEMLSVSRGLNLGIMLTLQRADASLFHSGTREQFHCVCSFARTSTEQFRMLGFSGELAENPTHSFKAGQALVLIDGQDGVQEIIVPFIKNSDEMCRGIRHYLDKQPDIPTLLRAIAAGKSENEWW